MPCAKCRPNAGTRTAATTPIPRCLARPARSPGGFLDRDRRLRRGVLRHPAARGRAHGPAAADVPRGRHRGARSCRAAARAAGRHRAPVCSSRATTTTTPQLAYNDPRRIDARTLTGTVHSVLANRLSYFLDLRGPSMSIDTACSSSLVAIHLACQSLRHGESDIALAGGVSLMISDGLMVALSKVGFMAPDGRCKTFDASADGFGRGEGCGVIVLKRLADAIADGDRVLALDPRLGRQPGRPLHRARRAERAGAAGGRSARRWPTRSSNPVASATSRRTAPAPRSATRSRSRRSPPRSGRRARRARPACSARRRRTSVISRPPPA